MIELSPIADVLSSFDLRVNEAGIWTIRDGRVAVGVVLLAESDHRIAVVRKKSVEGYEFSDMLALPGGVVRACSGMSFAEAAEKSVLARATDEAGLSRGNLKDFRVQSASYAPITRYTVKGLEQFAMVFAVDATVLQPTMIGPTRQSISEAFFTGQPFDWKEFAPANRLILAKARADHISDEQKIVQRKEIDGALDFCNRAAKEQSLPMLAHPWNTPVT
jgi:hypothetical protein